MIITGYILLMAFLGGIGGVVNSFQSGEVHWPRWDAGTKIWRPGILGSFVVGAVAAVLVWGVYGPASDYDLIKNDPTMLSLKLGQLLGSVVVGLSGSKIITLMAQKQADQITKKELVELTKNLALKSPDKG